MLVKFSSFYLSFFLAFGLGQAARAQKVDAELAATLKSEANHNLDRLKSLADEKKNNKIYEVEREKSLGLYLEEQEKWDSKRARDLIEFKKQKSLVKEPEDTPEYQQYLKEQKQAADKTEMARQAQVQTRQQFVDKNSDLIEKYENDELALAEERPRYELRKRGQNKWIKGSVGKGTAGKTTPDTDSSFPPAPVDFVPPPPPIMDNYEDIPPPPPPPSYDYGPAGGLPTYDGDIPPPPPSDFDF